MITARAQLFTSRLASLLRQRPADAEKLTVLIPCKDEIDNILDCIASIRSIADEILVADSGSTDGTLEPVRGQGECRIIEREYVNSADFKNWAIPQASHSWVFIVDADERVPAELAEEVRQVLLAPPADKDAYSCGFRDYFLGYRLDYAGWDTTSIRLIRRDVCRYRKRRVHSNIDIDPLAVGNSENTGGPLQYRELRGLHREVQSLHVLGRAGILGSRQACRRLFAAGPPSIAIPAHVPCTRRFPRRSAGFAGVHADVLLQHLHEARQTLADGLQREAPPVSSETPAPTILPFIPTAKVTSVPRRGKQRNRSPSAGQSFRLLTGAWTMAIRVAYCCPLNS